ncbi:unnamed protein product [Tenebrio molitor]|jgi:hypothetical protein|nr:unnamed protein product [Tenebrio molitor]
MYTGTLRVIDECRVNIPKCFKDYINLRIIFYCVEIQKPKCSCCRIKAYSHCRGRNTLKLVTCVSPGGLLTFTSKGFGGGASDKFIFAQSGVINKSGPYIDIIMERIFGG